MYMTKNVSITTAEPYEAQHQSKSFSVGECYFKPPSVSQLEITSHVVFIKKIRQLNEIAKYY